MYKGLASTHMGIGIMDGCFNDDSLMNFNLKFIKGSQVNVPASKFNDVTSRVNYYQFSVYIPASIITKFRLRLLVISYR